MQPILLNDVELLQGKLLLNLIKMHKLEATTRLQKLKNYYIGKQEIDNRTFSDTTKPNNKIAHSYGSYITNMYMGYFLGKPIKYTSSDDNFLSELKDIFDENDEQAHNSLIGKDQSICGIGYEIVYSDEEGKVKFAPLSPLEVFMVYSTDINPKPIASVRYYNVVDYLTDKTTLQVEVYTTSSIRYFKQVGDGLHFIEEVLHRFGDVPIIPYYNNDEEIGDYEKVITLIDNYDKQQSNMANDMDYFSDAYLMLKNMEADDADVIQMKQKRVMVIPEGGDAQWLVKQTDTTTIEAYKTRVNNDIHKISHVPDLSDEKFSGNLSGIALQYKFMGMEQVAGTKERLFKQGIQKRIKLITNFLNIKFKNYSFNDIKIVFERNLPVNVAEKVTMVKDSFGLVSEQTLLANHPFVDDAQTELESIKQENEANQVQYNVTPDTLTNTNK